MHTTNLCLDSGQNGYKTNSGPIHAKSRGKYNEETKVLNLKLMLILVHKFNTLLAFKNFMKLHLVDKSFCHSQK